MLSRQARHCLQTSSRYGFNRQNYCLNSRFISTSEHISVSKLLQEPSWSVRYLLPSTDEAATPVITSKQLHHLLRLSALPAPQSQEEEEKMLKTLQSQLHFVRQIQQLDTAGVEPLQALRDETKAAQEEQTLGFDALKESLSAEEHVGKHYKRVQRRARETSAKDIAEDWSPLAHPEHKAGNFFIVESEKP